MISISTTLFGKISHASLFFTGQLQNPWQMLAEPWGSAQPRLKITVLQTLGYHMVKTRSLSHVASHRYQDVTPGQTDG